MNFIEVYPISSNSLEKFYYINGNNFGQQYKEHLSDFNDWEQKEHSKDWLLFPSNIGTNLSIDETSLTNGELYTIWFSSVILLVIFLSNGIIFEGIDIYCNRLFISDFVHLSGFYEFVYFLQIILILSLLY